MNKQPLVYFKQQINFNEAHLTDVIAQLKEDGLKVSNRKLQQVLREIKLGLCVNPALINDLIDPRQATIGRPITHLNFTTSHIDLTQGEAVKKALVMHNILAIQGPPGAGKTTTIVEMIKQLRLQNPHIKVLITSQSHVAVDNVINILAVDGFGNDVARVRQTDTTDEGMKKYDVDKIYNKIFHNVDSRTQRVLSSYNTNDPSVAYGNKFVSDNRTGFMLVKDIIGVTINSLGSCGFGVNGEIDYAIIDEVGKCSFAEILMVAQIAKKLIVIGDPNQLAAVMHPFNEHDKYNKEAYDYIEENPYIDYLFTNINPECKQFLNRQYRMTHAIGTYISEQFYDGKLLNGTGSKNVFLDNALNFINYNENKCIVKTAYTKDGERMPLVNTLEIEIITRLLATELRDVPRNRIAIIAPYRGQIYELRQKFPEIGVNNISTVDAFQGREQNIVIFSCVRNSGLPTEYFKKTNRLNVAISRSKQRIYIVGAKRYVSQVSYLHNYINFNKTYVTAEGDKTARCRLLYFNGDNIVPHK